MGSDVSEICSNPFPEFLITFQSTSNGHLVRIHCTNVISFSCLEYLFVFSLYISLEITYLIADHAILTLNQTMSISPFLEYLGIWLRAESVAETSNEVWDHKNILNMKYSYHIKAKTYSSSESNLCLGGKIYTNHDYKQMKQSEALIFVE